MVAKSICMHSRVLTKRSSTRFYASFSSNTYDRTKILLNNIVALNERHRCPNVFFFFSHSTTVYFYLRVIRPISVHSNSRNFQERQIFFVICNPHLWMEEMCSRKISVPRTKKETDSKRERNRRKKKGEEEGISMYRVKVIWRNNDPDITSDKREYQTCANSEQEAVGRESEKRGRGGEAATIFHHRQSKFFFLSLSLSLFFFYRVPMYVARAGE